MRLIDADVLVDYYTHKPLNFYHTNYIIGKINITPTINAKPVIHAQWIGNDYGKCSACSYEGLASDIWNHVEDNGYCPNCGAKMDMEGEK